MQAKVDKLSEKTFHHASVLLEAPNHTLGSSSTGWRQSCWHGGRPYTTVAYPTLCVLHCTGCNMQYTHA